MKRSSMQPSVSRAKTSGHTAAFSDLSRTEMRNARAWAERKIEGGKGTVHRGTTQESSSTYSSLREFPITCTNKNESLPTMHKASKSTESQYHSCCAQSCSGTFAFTSLEPPVSEESLCELELRRLSNNLLLRHDLNFDRDITYRPNTHGLRGQLRTVQSFEYWSAITKELDILLTNDYTSPSSEPSHHTVSSTQACSSCAPELPRLSRMFDEVRMILKSLMHGDEWDAIDARLDIDLLVQQLKNRAFDLVALSDWLAVLLRRCCSSKRYHSIDMMTSSIRLGIERGEAQPITTGLTRLFEILESSKLVSEPLRSSPPGTG